jgi:hypothetical protein
MRRFRFSLLELLIFGLSQYASGHMGINPRWGYNGTSRYKRSTIYVVSLDSYDIRTYINPINQCLCPLLWYWYLIEFANQFIYSFIQLTWLFLALFEIMDCLLLFYHTNVIGLFWFYTGINQWNNITELNLDCSQSFGPYSLVAEVSDFINKVQFFQRF